MLKPFKELLRCGEQSKPNVEPVVLVIRRLNDSSPSQEKLSSVQSFQKVVAEKGRFHEISVSSRRNRVSLGLAVAVTCQGGPVVLRHLQIKSQQRLADLAEWRRMSQQGFSGPSCPMWQATASVPVREKTYISQRCKMIGKQSMQVSEHNNNV